MPVILAVSGNLACPVYRISQFKENSKKMGILLVPFSDSNLKGTVKNFLLDTKF